MFLLLLALTHPAALAAPARSADIASVTQQLERTAGGRRKAALQFELAELEYAQAEAAIAGPAGPNYGPALALLVIADAPNNAFEPTLALCRALRAEDPSYEPDAVLLLLGQALAQAGAASEANDAFTELVRTVPGSPLAPTAYAYSGDYWSRVSPNLEMDDSGAWIEVGVDGHPAAREAYTRAAEGRDAVPSAYARYRLAWLDLRDNESAIVALQDVVSSDPPEVVRAAALADLARFYSQAGALDRAQAWFASIGEDAALWDGLERAARLALDIGPPQQVERIDRLLIARDPLGPEAPARALQIVTAYTRFPHEQEDMKELLTLVPTYRPGAAWAQANAGRPEVVAQTALELEASLRAGALSWRSIGRCTGDTYLRVDALSLQLFALYFQVFSASEHAWAMHGEYAELLYHQRSYALAYDHYMAQVALDPARKGADFAAESAILAAVNVLREEARRASLPDPTARGPLRLPPPPRTPLTEWEAKELAAMDQLARLYPGHPRAGHVLFDAARLLYAHADVEGAAERASASLAASSTKEGASVAEAAEAAAIVRAAGASR